VEVTWIRPGDVDRAGTLVVRSASPIAWTPSDGAAYSPGSQPISGLQVVAADDADHSTTPLLDEPLAPGMVWHYAFFAYDEVPNYSAGVADTAETSTDAVAAPVAEAGLPGPLFRREGPHPLRSRIAFRFELPRAAPVELDVYDTTGRRVATLVRGERTAGSHRVEWDGRGPGGVRLAAGVYFVRFVTGALTATEKVVLVR
jgi:hypothetical protein